MINIYELLISLVVFETHSEFEEKVLTIFKAFDIDGGGELDRRELTKFLKCGIVGLCKMIKLKKPSVLGIAEFTQKEFKRIDADGSGSVDYEEFEEWVSMTKEIQDFLCMYSGVQTHRYAKLRYETEVKKW